MRGATRRGLLAGWVLALATPLMAAPPVPLVEQVRQRLDDAPVVRGQFEQRKTVKGFKFPLVSRGDFLLARERGVVWHTREPFESSLVITRDRLLSRRADGQPEQSLDARAEPGLRAVNEMLFALLAADLTTLASRFRIEGELLGTQAWRLSLAPRDAALAQWVTGIELEGASHVRSVRLQEAQGDTSVIRFSGHVQAVGLTREDEVRFE